MDDIIKAALEILDQYGLADLSMRRIASIVGVQAATIYWHFENKQSLLAGVSDAILAAQRPADTVTDWAHEFRRALLSHRDGAEIVAATHASGLRSEILDDPLIDLIKRTTENNRPGSSARILMHFCLGHVLYEQTRQNMIDFHVLNDNSALDDEVFSAGVEMIVAGIEAR